MITLTPPRLFRFFKIALLFLAVGLMSLSCEKKDDEEESGSEGQVEVNLLDEMREIFKVIPAAELQQFGIEVNQESVVRGKDGIVIKIPANAFVNNSGVSVKGRATVSLKEIFTAGDMIVTERPTVSGNFILKSGGAMFLNVTQSGAPLSLKPDKEIEIVVSAPNPDPLMSVFVGGQLNGNFDWVPNDSIDLSECSDTAIGSSYCFGIDTLFNWINCDYFYNFPGLLTEVDIEVPRGYTPENTVVYVYVPSINSLIPVRNFAGRTFTINSGYRLPEGLPVVFIGLHIEDNLSITVGIQDNQIVGNHVERLPFTPVSQGQLNDLLKNL